MRNTCVIRYMELFHGKHLWCLLEYNNNPYIDIKEELDLWKHLFFFLPHDNLKPNPLKYFWKNTGLGERKKETKEWNKQGIYPHGISQCLLVPKYLTIYSGSCDDNNHFRNEWLISLGSGSVLRCQPSLRFASAKQVHLVRASNIQSTRAYKGPAPELFWTTLKGYPASAPLIESAEPSLNLHQGSIFLSLSSPDSAFFPPLLIGGSPKNLFLKVCFPGNLTCEPIN